MKLILKIALILLTMTAGISFGQTFTTVTGVVEDQSSTVWTNATWTATLINPFAPQPPVYINGVSVSPTFLSGTVDGSGNFSATLPTNTAIYPQLPPQYTQWSITMCATVSTTNCQTLPNVTTTGTTQSLTTFFSTNLLVPTVKREGVAAAYVSGELPACTITTIGALYGKPDATVQQQCANVAGTYQWVTTGGSSGTGTDCASIPHCVTTNTAQTISATKTFNQTGGTPIVPPGVPSVYIAGNSSGGLGNRIDELLYGGGALVHLYRADGTVASPTAILTNDFLGQYGLGGYDGTVLGTSTSFQAQATENWNSTSHGSVLELCSTMNGTVATNCTWNIFGDGGLYASNATGASKGNGSINVHNGYYIDGVLQSGVLPVNPSVINDLVSFSNITGGQQDSGIPSSDVGRLTTSQTYTGSKIFSATQILFGTGSAIAGGAGISVETVSNSSFVERYWRNTGAPTNETLWRAVTRQDAITCGGVSNGSHAVWQLELVNDAITTDPAAICIIRNLNAVTVIGLNAPVAMNSGSTMNASALCSMATGCTSTVPSNSATITASANVTSAVCTTGHTCTNRSGQVDIVTAAGFTTGQLFSMTWTATTYQPNSAVSLNSSVGPITTVVQLYMTDSTTGGAVDFSGTSIPSTAFSVTYVCSQP